jgi:hypothetical protein
MLREEDLDTRTGRFVGFDEYELVLMRYYHARVAVRLQTLSGRPALLSAGQIPVGEP